MSGLLLRSFVSREARPAGDQVSHLRRFGHSGLSVHSLRVFQADDSPQNGRIRFQSASRLLGPRHHYPHRIDLGLHLPSPDVPSRMTHGAA